MCLVEKVEIYFEELLSWTANGPISMNCKWSDFNAPQLVTNQLILGTKWPYNVQNTCAQGAESNFIGAGIYPTLAMFNHSCDPSIVRFYVEDVVAVQESILLVRITGDIWKTLELLKV